MPETRFSQQPDQRILEKNMDLLRVHQPALAEKIRSARPGEDDLRIVQARTGHPVPVLQGRALHSLENPVEEGRRLLGEDFLNKSHRHVALFGFGFGYHVDPLLERGISPKVYLPNADLFRAMLAFRDMSGTFPFATFYTGDDLPDLPRRTEVLAHAELARLYPERASRMAARILKENPPKTNDIAEGVYYGSYGNVTCLKNPLDLMAYNQIIFQVRPTLILEIGTYRGGSALYFADLLRRMGGKRHVHTFDINDEVAPEAKWDPLITFHPGGWETFDPGLVGPDDRVLVIEDSAHTYENTLAVLRRFAGFVNPNSYFIVEDGATCLDRPEMHGGPLRAIEEFLEEDRRFEVDPEMEYLYGAGNSHCLKGFLRRRPG